MSCIFFIKLFIFYHILDPTFQTHTHTCSEQSLRILMWNVSDVQKHSNYTWQEWVGGKTRGISKRYAMSSSRFEIQKTSYKISLLIIFFSDFFLWIFMIFRLWFELNIFLFFYIFNDCFMILFTIFYDFVLLSHFLWVFIFFKFFSYF